MSETQTATLTCNGIHYSTGKKTVARVFYSSSNQANVNTARPGSTSNLRKTEKMDYIGHLFSRDGTSPR